MELLFIKKKKKKKEFYECSNEEQLQNMKFEQERNALIRN